MFIQLFLVQLHIYIKYIIKTVLIVFICFYILVNRNLFTLFFIKIRILQVFIK